MVQKKRSRPVELIGTSKQGGFLLSHLLAVPSALAGLTSLFGMERGGPRRHGHLNFEYYNDIKIMGQFKKNKKNGVSFK